MSKENYKNLKKFFIIIGVIAIVFIFLIIFLFIYLMVANPFGVNINPFSSQADSNYDHPLLSPEQEKTLQSIGVDIETVPTAITPAQEDCAVGALGQDRVNQIKAGADPSVSDYLKAKSCF